jgi:hypothetical protein
LSATKKVFGKPDAFAHVTELTGSLSGG